MYLVHVHREPCGSVSTDHQEGVVGWHTSGSIQSATASFAFEVLSFLMRDENLEVIEITLTCRDLLERVQVGERRR